MLEKKVSIFNKTSDLIFDLTNQSPRNLIGYWFHSLQTGSSYLFTSLGGDEYCLVSKQGILYSNPVKHESPTRRISALFVSKMFGTNNVIDYWKFVIPASENSKEQLIKLQGIQYEW
jgi:hypothetical protein